MSKATVKVSPFISRGEPKYKVCRNLQTALEREGHAHFSQTHIFCDQMHRFFINANRN